MQITVMEVDAWTEANYSSHVHVLVMIAYQWARVGADLQTINLK